MQYQGGSFQTRGNSETFVYWIACTAAAKGEESRGRGGCVGDDDAMEEDGNANDDNGGGYFVVLDVMAWNGAETYGCDVEFRSFWLQSKFARRNRLVLCRQPRRARVSHVSSADFSCATVNELRMCYEGARMKSFGGYVFACDGLIFRDKRASYTPGESTPLALLYKDEALCESCGEGTFRREVRERGCFLKVKRDGSGGDLCAIDDNTVLVSAGGGNQLNPNVAVRCEWEGDKLVPRETAKGKGTRPDAFSKIQFYIACKTNNPLTMDEIASSVCK